MKQGSKFQRLDINKSVCVNFKLYFKNIMGFMLNNSLKLCKLHKVEWNFSPSDQVDRLYLFNLLMPNANYKHSEDIKPWFQSTSSKTTGK